MILFGASHKIIFLEYLCLQIIKAMSTLELRVYEIFKNRFSEKEAETVIEFLDAKAEKKFEEKKEVLATKQDIAGVRNEIAEAKAGIIKWMFIFWSGSIITILGGLFVFLK